MTHFVHHVAIMTAATATKAKPNYLPTIIMLALFGGVWYFFLRPRRQAMKKQMSEQKSYEVGDEVVTIGGLIGIVVDIESDRVTIRSGVGATSTEMVFLKQAIKSRAPQPVVTEPAAESPEGDEKVDGAEDQ
ncbi:MAG: preprotein translocase subunit YajC [Actinomycetota bacterium]